MISMNDLYLKCPAEIGGDRLCYTNMASVMVIGFRQSDTFPCDKRYLPKAIDVRTCFGDTKVDPTVSPGCVSTNDCQRAVCACQASSRCNIDNTVALQMDSYGKMEICFSS